MKDFRRFIVEAKRRGLRLSPNGHQPHLDQHDGSSAPAAAIRNRARELVCMERHRPEICRTRIIFTDTENRTGPGIRKPDSLLAPLLSHQPDLNFDNPRVVSAIVQVMKPLARRPGGWLPSRAIPICASATAPITRTCRRPTPSSARLRAASTPMQGWARCAGGSQPCRGRTGIFRPG